MITAESLLHLQTYNRLRLYLGLGIMVRDLELGLGFSLNLFDVFLITMQ